MMIKKIWVIGISVIAILLVSAALTNGFGLLTGNIIAGEFSIPVSEISETAKFYEYDVGGTSVRFFAIKDGREIKTAFDACDVCYASKKGYRQEGSDMVCNNCGNRYPISGLGTENIRPGGCWPGYLPSKVVGDELIIQKSDLQNNAWRF